MDIKNSDAFFDSCVLEIGHEYERLGHQLGWRFLGVPKRVLHAPSLIAFIATHPGGSWEPPGHPRASCEAGNWYTTEAWPDYGVGEAPLQRQARLMFQRIAERTGLATNGDELLTQSLVSNLVPFRSPSFTELPRRPESLRFARRLWARVLSHALPSLVICLGRVTETAMIQLLPSALTVEHHDTATFPTGWGDYAATVHRFKADAHKTTIVTLPHLSRFSLFTSRKCAAPMQRVMDAACEGLV
jgi:hypothetical protein